MKNRVFLICVAFAQIVYAQHFNNNQWQEDIKYLSKELPRKHVNLFNSIDKKEFKYNCAQLINDIPILSDSEIALRAQQTIVHVNDTHTNVRWNSFIRNYGKKEIPASCFKAYWFKDGLYITGVRERDSIIVGKKIHRISNVPVNIVMDSLKTLFVNENQAVLNLEVPDLIARHQILDYFGFAPQIDSGYLNIEVEDEKGKILKHKIFLKNDRFYAPYASSSYLINGRHSNSFKGWFTDSYNESNAIYFVQYNKCYGKELAIRDARYSDKINLVPSFKDFGEKVIQTINSDSISKFIFDLRYNGGGSSWQGSQLINRLAEIEKLNHKQKIFVLIGRETFSSATLNVLDFKEKTDAIFVGEGTKGKPSHYGEVRELTLPNTRLKVGYSTKYFYHGKEKSKTYRSKTGIRKTNDERNTIQPDFHIELTFNDFVNQIDPVYEWICNK